VTLFDRKGKPMMPQDPKWTKPSAPMWPKKKSLCVAMVVYDAIEARTALCVSKLQQMVPYKKFDWHIRFGTYIDLARSTIVQQIRGYDYILFVDADIVFTNQHVMDLVHAYKPKYGAISGSYPYRDGSGRTTFGWLKEDGVWTTDEESYKRAVEHSNNGDIVPADKMPAGFMLTTGDTVKKLPSPSFACRWVQDELDDGTRVARFIGEDVFFVETMKRCGFTPMAHFGVQVGHIGKVPLGLMGAEIAPATQEQVT